MKVELDNFGSSPIGDMKPGGTFVNLDGLPFMIVELPPAYADFAGVAAVDLQTGSFWLLRSGLERRRVAMKVVRDD